MTQHYYYSKKISNAPIRRRLDRRFISWVLISVCVGTLIASGFVFSAKCHFEAVALGYQTQQERSQLDLQEERRRQLELERARALAPEELEQRARGVGMRNPEVVPVANPDESTPDRRTARRGQTEPAARPIDIDADEIRAADTAANAAEPQPARKVTE